MPEELIRRKRRLSSFQIITLGFAGVILLGALLLMLPISTTGENVTPFNETLFTATSAVCVTGLVVQDTGCYWSTFGQAVILALIQIGGLGVVTVAASFALLSGRKISLMQRSTMQDAISAPKVGGIVRLTRCWERLPCCRCSAGTMDGAASGWRYFIPYPLFATPGLTFLGQKATTIHLLPATRTAR